jgi:hypothetical protein
MAKTAVPNNIYFRCSSFVVTCGAIAEKGLHVVDDFQEKG